VTHLLSPTSWRKREIGGAASIRGKTISNEELMLRSQKEKEEWKKIEYAKNVALPI